MCRNYENLAIMGQVTACGSWSQRRHRYCQRGLPQASLRFHSGAARFGNNAEERPGHSLRDREPALDDRPEPVARQRRPRRRSADTALMEKKHDLGAPGVGDVIEAQSVSWPGDPTTVTFESPTRSWSSRLHSGQVVSNRTASLGATACAPKPLLYDRAIESSDVMACGSSRKPLLNDSRTRPFRSRLTMIALTMPALPRRPYDDRARPH